MNIQKLFNESLRFFYITGYFCLVYFRTIKRKKMKKKIRKKNPKIKQKQIEHGISGYEEVR